MGSISAARLIAPRDVGSWLAKSVLTHEPVLHVSTPTGIESILRQGIVLQAGGKDALGRGLYAATRAERVYGSDAVRLAIPTERPLRIPFLLHGSDSYYLWRVARATGTTVRELRAAGGRIERLEAARQALLGAGYDSVASRIPWPNRNLWVVGLDPSRIRIVADDQVLAGIGYLRPAGALDPRPLASLEQGDVLGGPAALTSAARELATSSPTPISWQVRQLDDPAIRAALAERTMQPGDLFLVDNHKLMRGHELGSVSQRLELASLRRRGAQAVPYGGRGDWLHGKLISGSDETGRAVALLRTNTDDRIARRQANVGVVLRDDAARAADALIRTTASGDPAAVRAAAEHAATFGLLTHDAFNGVDQLRPAIADVLRSGAARGEHVTVIEKELRHAPSAQLIADAQRGGAMVQATLGKVDDASLKLLRDAGVDVRINAGWVNGLGDAIRLGRIRRSGVPVEARLVRSDPVTRFMLRMNGVPISDRPFAHGNVFANEREAIATSFHHFPAMAELHGSQELGMRVEGDQARSVVATMQQQVGPTG